MSGFFSGGLGSLAGALLGGGGQNAAAGMLAQVIAANGGIGGIIGKFEQAGLGDKVGSWVGTGHNLPITVEQVNQVFPPGQLDAWGQQHGLPPGTAELILAHVLPHAVDAATPAGTIPPAGQPQSPLDLEGILGRMLRGTTT